LIPSLSSSLSKVMDRRRIQKPARDAVRVFPLPVPSLLTGRGKPDFMGPLFDIIERKEPE
jgi:hypothetical protein